MFSLYCINIRKITLLAFQERKKYGKEENAIFEDFQRKYRKWWSGKHALRTTFGNTAKSGD